MSDELEKAIRDIANKPKDYLERWLRYQYPKILRYDSAMAVVSAAKIINAEFVDFQKRFGAPPPVEHTGEFKLREALTLFESSGGV